MPESHSGREEKGVEKETARFRVPPSVNQTDELQALHTLQSTYAQEFLRTHDPLSMLGPFYG